MTREIYQKKITVSREHLDELQHVNNVIYLQWVQDIAAEHWRSKVHDGFDTSHYWVVLDHFIEYKGQAFLNDIITIETFVEKNLGLRSTRVVEFYKGEKSIVRAHTNWCLINRISGRPIRIPPEIDQLFFTDV
jgi:acyl-CoA thioester hydrolase